MECFLPYQTHHMHCPMSFNHHSYLRVDSIILISILEIRKLRPVRLGNLLKIIQINTY